MMLPSTLMSAWLVACAAPDSGVEKRPVATLTALRRTAVGGILGFSSTGLSVRHRWRPRFLTDLALYSTFGRRFGVHSVSAQFLLVLAERRWFRLYGLMPVRWIYLREPTEIEANFRPDGLVREVHRLRFGIGPGLELFLGPHVSVVTEFPVAMNFESVSRPNTIGSEGVSHEPMPAPNIGLYVYFQ